MRKTEAGREMPLAKDDPAVHSACCKTGLFVLLKSLSVVRNVQRKATSKDSV